MSRSKSLPSPRRAILIISRFTSNTDRLVPSKLICDGSFWDLKRKKIDEDMVADEFCELDSVSTKVAAE